MLSDEEIEEVWRESSNGGYCNLVKIDFARAVESAVLKRAVATVVKVFDHAFNTVDAENRLFIKVKGNRPSLQNVIDALEGRWKP
jgi:hypothetical protein